jgi:hypothetical protein
VDFLELSTTMMNQAQQQGVDVDAISPGIAQGCRFGGAERARRRPKNAMLSNMA